MLPDALVEVDGCEFQQDPEPSAATARQSGPAAGDGYGLVSPSGTDSSAGNSAADLESQPQPQPKPQPQPLEAVVIDAHDRRETVRAGSAVPAAKLKQQSFVRWRLQLVEDLDGDSGAGDAAGAAGPAQVHRLSSSMAALSSAHEPDVDDQKPPAASGGQLQKPAEPEWPWGSSSGLKAGGASTNELSRSAAGAEPRQEGDLPKRSAPASFGEWQRRRSRRQSHGIWLEQVIGRKVSFPNGLAATSQFVENTVAWVWPASSQNPLFEYHAVIDRQSIALVSRSWEGFSSFISNRPWAEDSTYSDVVSDERGTRYLVSAEPIVPPDVVLDWVVFIAMQEAPLVERAHLARAFSLTVTSVGLFIVVFPVLVRFLVARATKLRALVRERARRREEARVHPRGPMASGRGRVEIAVEGPPAGLDLAV
eukprot:tig00001327_g8244.t1